MTTNTNTSVSPKDEARSLLDHLKSILPNHVDGKDAVLKLKNNDSPHWKQMEWPGFFFEEIALNNLLVKEGSTYRNTTFDVEREYVWDMKAHTMRDMSGEKVNAMYLNDSTAMEAAVLDGGLGFIVAYIDVEYDDEDNSFFWWRTRLKGGLSDYQKRKASGKGKYEPGRKRKTAFVFCRIEAYWIDNIGELGEAISDGWIIKTGQGENADGSERKDKYVMKPHKIPDEEVLYQVEFEDNFCNNGQTQLFSYSSDGVCGNEQSSLNDF